jgi:hypothetical protein
LPVLEPCRDKLRGRTVTAAVVDDDNRIQNRDLVDVDVRHIHLPNLTRAFRFETPRPFGGKLFDSEALRPVLEAEPKPADLAY